MSEQSKILQMIYFLLYKLDEFNIFKSNWLSSIRCRPTLNDSGFPGIWLDQYLPSSVNTFRNILKLRLKDQFIQKWHESISESRKCINYRIFFNHFKLEKYLFDLPDTLCRLNVDATKTSRPICVCAIIAVKMNIFTYLSAATLKTKEKKIVESKFWKRPSTSMLKELCIMAILIAYKYLCS